MYKGRLLFSYFYVNFSITLKFTNWCRILHFRKTPKLKQNPRKKSLNRCSAPRSCWWDWSIAPSVGRYEITIYLLRSFLQNFPRSYKCNLPENLKGRDRFWYWLWLPPSCLSNDDRVAATWNQCTVPPNPEIYNTWRFICRLSVCLCLHDMVRTTTK